MPDLHSDKIEVQRQWDRDPCAADTVTDVPRGTLEYYRAIRKHRYEVYAPWMPQAMGFSEWRGKRILEIGVGLGSDHYMLAKGGNRMTALDLSREHLQHTKRHLNLEGLDTEATYGDAEVMPFEDNKFDVVYSFGVLHHTPDMAAAFREVRRVLKPGGTSVIGVYHRYSWFFIIRTCLMRGILRGRFVTRGYRRTLSEIEYRADQSSATPLVQLLSRRQLRRYFEGYASVSITCCHVELTHLGVPRWFVSHLFSKFIKRAWLEKWLGFGGWYLIVRAVK